MSVITVTRKGYRAEWKPAGPRLVTVCCREEMFDPGPIISVTGPGIIGGPMEFSARRGAPKIRQLEEAADACAGRFGEYDL